MLVFNVFPGVPEWVPGSPWEMTPPQSGQHDFMNFLFMMVLKESCDTKITESVCTKVHSPTVTSQNSFSQKPCPPLRSSGHHPCTHILFICFLSNPLKQKGP